MVWNHTELGREVFLKMLSYEKLQKLVNYHNKIDQWDFSIT